MPLSKLFAKKPLTVASVVAQFDQMVRDLDSIQVARTAEASQIEGQIESLRDAQKAAREEASRAASVSMKLEALVS